MIATADRFPSKDPNDGPALGTIRACEAVDIVASLNAVESDLEQRLPDCSARRDVRRFCEQAREALGAYILGLAGKADDAKPPRVWQGDGSRNNEAAAANAAVALYRMQNAVHEAFDKAIDDYPSEYDDNIAIVDIRQAMRVVDELLLRRMAWHVRVVNPVVPIELDTESA